MPNRLIRLSVLLPVLALSACRTEWVQLSPEGEAVSLATASEVADCRRLGSATVNALDSIGFVGRNAETLQRELVRLARNEAGEADGNRVIPESTIAEGRQTFGIYRCP